MAEKVRYTVEVVPEKETTNTIRYKEVPKKGQPLILRTVYLPKWIVGNSIEEAPKKIKITIEF
jgi:hypothetical protein